MSASASEAGPPVRDRSPPQSAALSLSRIRSSTRGRVAAKAAVSSLKLPSPRAAESCGLGADLDQDPARRLAIEDRRRDAAARQLLHVAGLETGFLQLPVLC